MDKVFFQTLTDVCHDHLIYNSKKIYSYLKKRGMTDETIKEYKLGAFPKDLRFLFNKIHPEELLRRGIIYRADKSPFSMYPVVIPIRDTFGNPVAIGCRTLKSDDERKELGIPKYRNSVYSKTSTLFALDKAVPFIRKANRVFVVEGYFDAITAHQFGMKNVVATCGTMFSSRQLTILSRYTDNICILFDNDEPGRANADKVLNKFVNNEFVKLTCAFTPDKYKDLDEYFRSGGSLDYFEV